MQQSENILDYHQFYLEFKQNDYMPLRVNDEWLLENENYLRETLFSFYQVYSRSKNPSEIINSLFKLYADVILHTYIHFDNGGSYL